MPPFSGRLGYRQALHSLDPLESETVFDDVLTRMELSKKTRMIVSFIGSG